MVQEQKDLGIHEHDHIMGMLKKKKGGFTSSPAYEHPTRV